jgi:hypothetical protein
LILKKQLRIKSEYLDLALQPDAFKLGTCKFNIIIIIKNIIIIIIINN